MRFPNARHTGQVASHLSGQERRQRWLGGPGTREPTPSRRDFSIKKDLDTRGWSSTTGRWPRRVDKLHPLDQALQPIADRTHLNLGRRWLRAVFVLSLDLDGLSRAVVAKRSYRTGNADH